MPVDPSKALGAKLPEGKSSYNADSVILYHLGVGAGSPATDAGELQYTYEKNLKVLPSFAVIPAFGSMGGIGGIDGLEFDFMMLLHGEQEVVLHRPLPPKANLTTNAHIAEIWDKGKAALVILESNSSDEQGPLFTNRFSLFLRGEGGFGGEPGPKAGNQKPDRAPDGVIVDAPGTEPSRRRGLLPRYRLAVAEKPAARPAFRQRREPHRGIRTLRRRARRAGAAHVGFDPPGAH
jgi:hypothetical protein